MLVYNQKYRILLPASLAGVMTEHIGQQTRPSLVRVRGTGQKGKGKVVYGQEPPSGESTTTECGFNYQLLAVITEVAQWGAPSCSQPQPAMDNGVRDGRSN